MQVQTVLEVVEGYGCLQLISCSDRTYVIAGKPDLKNQAPGTGQLISPSSHFKYCFSVSTRDLVTVVMQLL